MTGSNEGEALFRWLDRLFWLVWAAFPIAVWQSVTLVLDPAILTSGLSAAEEACLALLPRVSRLSGAGQTAFWAMFVLETAVIAALLALAHRTIHRFARGRVFVTDTIAALRHLGLIVLVWPFATMALDGLLFALLSAAGDPALYAPAWVPDLPTVAVGGLILTLAASMRRAVRMHEDAELTI